MHTSAYHTISASAPPACAGRPAFSAPPAAPPEADVQGEEQHRVHSGERGRDGGREHGTLQNRCIQDQRRKEVHRADHSDGKAAAEPTVFLPQGAKAQQQQHRPDGGENVVQAQKVQGDRAQRHAEEDAVHGAPPRRHLGHDLLRRRVGDAPGQHGLKVRVRYGLPRAVTHGPHLPTSCAAAFQAIEPALDRPGRHAQLGRDLRGGL